MNKIIFILLLLIVSCKPAQQTTTTHFINDSIITHRETTIQLPVKNVTIIENPCLDSILKPFNQTIQSGKTTVIIKEIQGKISAEINIDSLVNSKISEQKNHQEKQTSNTIITKNKIPKWIWYVLGFNLIYIAYRIARIYFPIIKFLPY